MNEANDFNSIERRLVAAFKARARAVEPSPDSYARLAKSVNEQSAGSFRRWGDFGSYLRSLGFVAATVVTVGLGGYVISLQGDQAVDTANAAPAMVDPTEALDDQESDLSQADETAAAEAVDPDTRGVQDSYRAGAVASDTSESVDQSASTVVGGGQRIESDPDRRLEGQTYAPVGDTTVDAAEKFLDLLGVTDVAVAEDDTADDRETVLVSTLSENEGESGELLTTLVVGPIGDGFVVEEARTGRYNFSFVDPLLVDPTDDDIDDPVFLIGEVNIKPDNPSSDAQAMSVDLRPAFPGDTTIVRAGGSNPGGIVGASRVWVVVRDAANPQSPFAARPAYFRGDDDLSSYTVVGLPPDDPDGGLILRADPNGEETGVIALGSVDVRRRTIAARLANGLTWWAVTTPDGRQGWVAADYLSAADPVSDDVLVELARRFATAVLRQDPLPDGMRFDYPVYVGSIGQPQLVQRQLEAPNAWTLNRQIANRPAAAIDEEISLADFYGVERWAEAEISVPTDYADPDAEHAAEAYFGGLPSVVIRSQNPETGRWERVHLFVSNQAIHNAQPDNLGGGITDGVTAGVPRGLAILGIVREVEPVVDITGGEGETDPDGPTITVPEPEPDKLEGRSTEPDAG